MMSSAVPDATVFVVDDEPEVCKALGRLFRSAGWPVRTFGSAREFLDAEPRDRPGCLVTDLRLPGVNGLDLFGILRSSGRTIPVIIITGHGDVATSVRAMKAGAVDFLMKPVEDTELLAAVERATAQDAEGRRQRADLEELTQRLARLTPREHEVFGLVVAGLLNKQIAGRLGTSEQTVKVHRARVMQKMAAASLAQLVHFADRLESPSAEDSAAQNGSPGSGRGSAA
jgi:FixJ family two-component response regulator